MLTATLLLTLGWLGTSSDAGAEDSGPPLFSFSSFGTLGAVHSSEGRADFNDSVRKPNGAGFTHAWSTDVDSRLAGQVTANFTPHLSVVVQCVSEQQYDNTYRPHVEWANIKYKLTPDLSIRAGRIVLGSFLVSDARNLGYANPWVRPPIELYRLVPVTNSDGVDASYKIRSGDWSQTLTGSFGRLDLKFPGSEGEGASESRARQLWLISDTLEYGAATARVTYQDVHLTIPALNGLFDAMRNFGAQGIALADKYELANRRVTFIGLGAMYDPGKWFVTGEWGHLDYRSVLGRNTAWYASAGYRWAQLTPYLAYSEVKADSNRSDPGLTLSVLPPALVGPAIGLNAGLNAVLNEVPSQTTVSVGVRWDFIRSMDLKLQYDHTRLGTGSAGTLTNVQPNFRPGGTVNLFTITVDFVL